MLAEHRGGTGTRVEHRAARDAELERSVTLTSAAEALAETVRDAVERTLRAAARADISGVDEEDADGGCRFVVDPDALESVWRAFESQETASTTRLTADGSPSASAETAETSVSPTFPPEFIARCLQRLNDELAMELFLPLADAAAEDGALVTATVDHRNTREAVFAWRAEKRTDTDAQSSDSETATALALALDGALAFVGEHARLAGRPRFAKDALGSTWEAVAAATQSRWFDDDTNTYRDDATSRSSSPSRETVSEKAYLRARLSDDAVAKLCAAEATAASLGASPAAPAAGPVELAAFERERRAAEAVSAAALAEAARVIAEGERTRATARVGGSGSGSDDGASRFPDDGDADKKKMSAEAEEEAAFAAYAAPTSRFGPTSGLSNVSFPRLPFPACAVSVSAARLGGLVAATLARARALRLFDSRSVSDAASRATLHEAEATERAACDILEYWRATVPSLRGPAHIDAVAAVAAGGPAAAATFRNDAHFLGARFAAAAFAFGFGDGIPPDSDVSSEKSVSVQKRFPKHRSHPNLLWVLPPLCRFGDEVLDALVGEASRTVALETAAFGRRFAAGLETRSDAEEATRALRRARRCLGSTIGAFVQLLPKPVASTHASSLLRRYANEVVENAFAVSDVSRDACERARDALREAFSSSGVLPLAILSEDSEVKTTLDERRERTEALFVEILKRAPSATRAAWSKGEATGSLFETSLGDIGEGVVDGRWARLGFEPGEIRALVRAVFEDSQRRHAVLEMLAEGMGRRERAA